MKKPMYAFLLSFFLLAAAALADVKTDYDHAASFSRYQTFAWKAGKAAPNGLGDNSLVAGRVQYAVNRQLMSKGFREDSKSPDVYLSYRFATKERRDMENGWRRWGWYDPYVYEYTKGTLVIDMLDAKTNHLVWRAYCTNTGSSPLDVQNAKQVDQLVAGAFKHFPPRDKG